MSKSLVKIVKVDSCTEVGSDFKVAPDETDLNNAIEQIERRGGIIKSVTPVPRSGIIMTVPGDTDTYKEGNFQLGAFYDIIIHYEGK